MNSHSNTRPSWNLYCFVVHKKHTHKHLYQGVMAINVRRILLFPTSPRPQNTAWQCSFPLSTPERGSILRSIFPTLFFAIDGPSVTCRLLFPCGLHFAETRSRCAPFSFNFILLLLPLSVCLPFCCHITSFSYFLRRPKCHFIHSLPLCF